MAAIKNISNKRILGKPKTKKNCAENRGVIK
jgi:hypothetical protein